MLKCLEGLHTFMESHPGVALVAGSCVASYLLVLLYVLLWG